MRSIENVTVDSSEVKGRDPHDWTSVYFRGLLCVLEVLFSSVRLSALSIVLGRRSDL
jgi:hypothetical protein